MCTLACICDQLIDELQQNEPVCNDSGSYRLAEKPRMFKEADIVDVRAPQHNICIA